MGWRKGEGKPPLGGGILSIFDMRFSPSCLEFSAKGSVLEARKERVQLGAQCLRNPSMLGQRRQRKKNIIMQSSLTSRKPRVRLLSTRR
jgi:hypothetical protein